MSDTSIADGRRAVLGRLANGPFVGRGALVEAARLALEGARAERGQSLLFYGEAGIGKTRFADEVIGLAQSVGFRPISARCHELEGAPALWPWVQVARHLLEGLAVDRRQAFIESTGKPLAQLVPEFAAPGLPGNEAHQPSIVPDRYSVFDAMAQLLSIASRESPLLVVIDDLHWADPASVLMARYALRELRRDRVVFLGLYRDTDVLPDDPLAKALGDLGGDSEGFRLEGLEETEIARLVGLVAGFDVSDVLLAALEAQTGGNPFFMVEILRLLATEGRLGAPDSPSPEPIPLPHSVRHTLERRIERLSPATRETLHQAAAFGREFDREALEAAHHAGSEVASHLDDAMFARLIEAVANVPGRFRFAHDLVNQTLGKMLSTNVRAGLHLRAAEALLRTRHANLEDHYGALARHFSEATLQTAGQSETVATARRAFEYSVLAAQHATSNFSFELAVQLFRQALRALDLIALADDASNSDREEPEPILQQRGDVLVQIGNALWQSGLAVEATEADREVEKLARRLNDPNLLAHAAIGLSGRSDLPMDPEEDLVDLLAEALAGMQGENPKLRVRLLAHLVRATSYGPHREHLVSWAQEAISLAEDLEDPGALFAAREALHYALLIPGHLEERLEISADLPALARQVGSRRLEAIGWLWRIFDLIQIPDIAATDAAITRLEAVAAGLHQPFWEWLSLGVRACRAQMDGNLEEVERLIFKALEVGKRAGTSNALIFFGTQLFHLREEQCRSDELLPVMQKIVDDRPGMIVFRICIPLIHARGGREEESRRTFEEVAAQEFRDVPHDFHRMPMLNSCATVAAYLGDAARARTLLQELRQHEGRVIMSGVVTQWEGCVDRSMGNLEETLGNFSEAVRLYASAAGVADRAGARLHKAHALVDWARALRLSGADGAEEKAGRIARRADIIYEELGIHESCSIIPKIVVPNTIPVDREGPSAGVPNTRSPESADPSKRPAIWIRNDHHWGITFGGSSIELPESKGLTYLQHLIACPGEDIRALDLVSLESSAPAPVATEWDGGKGGVEPATLEESSTNVVDGRALEAYRRRLHELGDLRRTAEENRDLARLAAIDDEHEQIETELASVTGLGGRVRQTSHAAERARKAVYNRIRASIKRIYGEHPALGKHLEHSVSTGSTCVYRPESPVDWKTGSDRDGFTP